MVDGTVQSRRKKRFIIQPRIHGLAARIYPMTMSQQRGRWAERGETWTRRALLSTTFAAGASSVTGCLGGSNESDTEQGVTDAEQESWIADANGSEGIDDHRGTDTVQVEVGPESSTLAFVPAAIRVDPGTTVRWEWGPDTTEHNVVGVDADFESELTAAADTRFSHQFDDPGTVRYHCRPHRELGMRGLVIVGEP